MKSNDKLKALFICLTIILALSYGVTNNFEPETTSSNDNNKNFKVIKPKISGSWTFHSLVINESGGGNYTWQEASAFPWCEGSGAWNDPYVLENITINGKNSTSCITIAGSDAYFIVQNCTLYNGTADLDKGALFLYNVSNGILFKNNISNNNGLGIYLNGTNNITVLNNDVNQNTYSLILDYCNDSKVLKNNVTYNDWLGIYLYESYNNSILEYQNSPFGRNDENLLNSTHHQRMYTFTDREFQGDLYNSYGTHDWVADSAVRLILQNSEYRDTVLWLFEPSSAGSSDNKAPFKDFGSTQIIKVDGKFYFTYYTDSSSLGMIKETWLKARRYVNLLHGTGVPDWPGKDIYIEPYFNREEAVQYTTKWKGSRGHHIRFEFTDDILGMIPDFSESPIIRLTQFAAIDSKAFADSQFSTEDAHGQSVNLKGKYEAVAQCLGGIAHFIADVAHPAHVDDRMGHSGWDRYMDKYTRFNLSHFINGGPNWDSNCNPSYLSSNLIPIPPTSALIFMAEDTYAAIDVYGPVTSSDFSTRPMAAGNPNFPSKSGDPSYDLRIKELIERAAYYTACAFLYVIRKCNIPDDTTTNRGTTIYEVRPIQEPMPVSIPLSKEKIEEIVAKVQGDYYDPGLVPALQMNVMMLSCIIIPIIAIIIIPVLFIEVTKKEIKIKMKI